MPCVDNPHEAIAAPHFRSVGWLVLRARLRRVFSVAGVTGHAFGPVFFGDVVLEFVNDVAQLMIPAWR
jgi:hypothetical protein